MPETLRWGTVVPPIAVSWRRYASSRTLTEELIADILMNGFSQDKELPEPEQSAQINEQPTANDVLTGKP